MHSKHATTSTRPAEPRERAQFALVGALIVLMASTSIACAAEILPKPPVPFKGNRPGNGGIGRLSVNGAPAGQLQFINFSNAFYGALDVGRNNGSPISNDYATPFAFTGKIDKVLIDVKP